MKLSIAALTMATTILWGGGVLLVAIANLLWPSYGGAFLQLLASVYPGYDATRSVGGIVIGTLYALVDGALCGLLFGWLYNRFVGG